MSQVAGSKKHAGAIEELFGAHAEIWRSPAKFSPGLSSGANGTQGIDATSLQKQPFAFPRYLKEVSTFMPLGVESLELRARAGPLLSGKKSERAAPSVSYRGSFISLREDEETQSHGVLDSCLGPEGSGWMENGRKSEKPADAAKTSMFLEPPLFSRALPPPSDPRFAIVLSRVRKDCRTTCMIKNIPNKYTLEMLIELLNEDHYGAYDFVYLRMDFQNNCNVGYAFVNFIDVEYVHEFYIKIHGMAWKRFSSRKIAELTYASIQGLDSLKRKFRRSGVMSEHESYRPRTFHTSGPYRGQINPDFF
jgi:hypothetical protein